MKKVFISGPFNHDVVRMFGSQKRFVGTKNVTEADLVVFTGGADIDPQLYGERPLSTTMMDQRRDEVDLENWLLSPLATKVGICRGAQFLNVMNGGKLWQDVDEHRQPHFIKDIWSGRDFWATSTHHQAMIPGPSATVQAVGCFRHSSVKRAGDFSWERTSDTLKDPAANDFEVLWYKETDSLCFQPHPEYSTANRELREYFFTKLGMAMGHRDKKVQDACAAS